VQFVSFPTIDASGESTIANFPNEAEHLVVLYASIKCLERQMFSEEDMELYMPVIKELKEDYNRGIAEIKA